VSTWQLACPCGSAEGSFVGYPLRLYAEKYDGDAFVGPLGFECANCGRLLEVFDTEQHGYHAECSDSSQGHICGEGPREKFKCRHCGSIRFIVLVSFFYWEASMDLVEDEPGEFAAVAQNLFCEFVANGRCVG